MAKTAIVGRVAVKVLPDTSDFRGDLKDDLERIARGQEVYVDIAFSITQMKKALLESVKTLNAEIRGSDVYRVVVGLGVEANAQTYRDLKRAIRETQLAATGQQIELGTTVKGARNVAAKALVKPELDRGAFEKVKALLEQMNAEAKLKAKVVPKDLAFARAAMENALNERFKLKLGVEKNSLVRAKETIKQTIGDAWFNIHARADMIRTAKENAKLQKLIGDDFETVIKPSLSFAAANLVKTQLKTLFNAEAIRIKTMLDPKNIPQIKKILKASFNDVKVKVKAVVDNKSVQAAATAIYAMTGARLAAKKFIAFDYLFDLDKNLPAIVQTASKIGIMGTAAVSAAGHVLSLVHALGSIVPAALAAPGVIMAMGTAIASTAMAMKDMKTQVPQFSAAMSAMSKANNAAFWEKARKPMQEIVTVWQPKLISGFQKVGSANGALFASLIGNLQKVVTSRLDTWFKAVADGLNAFVSAGGTGGLANIIRGFGDLGAIYFPMLWGWLGKIIGQFGAWLTNAVATGQAMQWVNNAIVLMGELAGLVGTAAQIIWTLATAAAEAGGAGFGQMKSGLDSVLGALRDPVWNGELVKTLSAAFQAMGVIMSSLGTSFVGILTMWTSELQRLFPLIGQIGAGLATALGDFLTNPAVTDGIYAIFGGINTLIQTLLPQVGALGVGFGAFFQLIGVAASSVAPLLALALKSVGDAAHGILGALIQVVPLLAGGFFQAFSVLEPVISTLSTVLGQLIIQVGTALANAFVYLTPMLDTFAAGLTVMLQVLGPIVGGIITQLVEGLTPVLGLIFEALGNLMVALAPLVESLGGALSAALAVILPAIQQAAQDLLPMIVDALSNLARALQPVIDNLAAFLRENQPAISAFLAFLIETIGSAIPGIINGIAGVISGVTQVISGIITVFKGIFTGNWTQVWEGAKQILSGAWEAIKGIVNIALNIGVLGIVKAGWNAIKVAFTQGPAFLKQAWQALWQLIKDLATNGWNGIKTLLNNGWTAIKSLFTSSTNALKSGWEGMWNMLKTAASGAWEAIKTTFRNGVEGAFNFVKSLPDRIRGVFTGAANFLSDSGKAIMDGLASGIRNGIDGAVGAARNAMDAISRLFPHSPAKEGPFSGKGWTPYSGMAIAEGLAEGIRKKSSLAPDAVLDMMASTHDAIGTQVGLAGSARGAVNIGGGTSETNYINLEVHVDDLLKVTDLNEYLRAQRQRKRQKMGG